VRWARTYVTESITKDQIAEAVDEAVRSVTGDDGLGACTLYARAGAGVAEFVLKKPYTWQAGAMVLCNAVGKPIFEQRPTQEHPKRFHCWIIDRPDDMYNADMWTGDDRECADFLLRNAKALIEKYSLQTNLPPLPDRYWGTMGALRAMGVCLEMDKTVRRYLLEVSDELVRQVAIRSAQNLDILRSGFADWWDGYADAAPDGA
jgi:hypothetical protein